MQKIKHFLFMAAMLLCSFTASAHDFEVNGIYYQITSSSNLTVAVTYKGDNWNNYSEEDKYIGNISIPQYVTYDNVTYQVTSVADYAFYYCTKLTHIILPEGIADIGYMSFYRCDSLTSIIIPEGVVSLGSWAFGECANLKSATLPSSLSEFGYYPVFQCCNSLDYIVCYAENPPTASGMAPFYGVDKSIPVYVPASSVSAYQSEECWSESTDVQPLAVVSGACGDNLTWQFTNYDGLLIIEGTGTMFDYDTWENNAPWYEYKDLISEIVIDKGVTSIGGCAFYECRSMHTVTIPESITSVGNYAFMESGIDSVYIPKAVSVIGQGLFGGCNSLRKIIVDEGNEVYDSREDCNAIIETNTDWLIAGCSSTVIPSTVTLIGPAAFYTLHNIVAIDIPESVTEISHNAFRECDLSSIVIPRNVSSIGILAFADCNKLGSIICHAEEPPRCGGNPFSGVDKSIPIYVPASSVEAYQTATSWNEFTNIQPIPSNDIASGTCGDNLTWRLTEEYELIIEGEGAMYDYQRSIFGNTEVWEETKDTIDTPWYVFRESIEKVMLGEGVVSIGAYAFYNCSNLTAIKIPKEIVEIGFGALGNCVKLTSIEVSEKNTIYDSREDCNAIIETSCDSLVVGCLTTIIPNSVKVIGQCAFYGTPLTSISIPNGVERIYANGFYKCLLLETIFIPATVESIHDMAFVLCKSLRSIVIDSENPIYTSGPNNSYIMEKGSKTLMTGTTKGDIPEGVEHIGRYAFAGRNLGHIHIPDEVISLEDCAFLGSSITSIRIPASLTHIGNQAFGDAGRFYFCNKLEAVYIEHLESWFEIDFSGPYSPLYFAKNLYLNGEKLETLEIPESVTILKKYVLEGWNGTEIIIPNDSKLASIDSYAFAFDGISCLTAITCHKTAPPVAFFESFSGVDKSIPVYVPASSVEAYKSAKYWSDFTNIQPLPNEYTLTVSAAGYASLYLDYATEIPDDVKVYIATSVEGDRLMMTEVEDVLPANTGVIVRAKAGTYTFVESEDTPADVEGNLLTGTATDTYITAESGYAYYVLDKPEGKEVGMYKAKLTDGQFLNNANRAYLALDLGNLGIFDDEVGTEEEGGQLSNRLRFDFGGTTAIDNAQLTSDNFENVIYDLQGRRVMGPTKGGIYIIGGKKVVITD